MTKCVLVTGGDGLLAQAIRRMAPPDFNMVFLGHTDFDLTNPAQMKQQWKEFRPQVVINTAAYNLVDRCEVERDLSWAVNGVGPQKLAGLCGSAGCRLVHFGTDYVFDGVKKSPYTEE